MTSLFTRFKTYIKSLELDLSDLMLVIGFLFFVPFAAFAWKFMVTPNPTEIFFAPWMMIVCFIISVFSWGVYFYLEIKRGRLKNNLFLWAFVLLAILGLVAVLVQPETVKFLVECKKRPTGACAKWNNGIYAGVKVGDIVEVVHTISPTHRLFFSFATILITTVYFIIFTLLPRRLKDMNLLILAAVCTFGFLLVASIYSFIRDGSHYIPFLKALFKGDNKELYKHAILIQSFMTHRVPYGVCMMLGCMFALVGHALTKKWYWFIPFAYCFINMIFTWCKTALIITPLILLAYIVILLIEGYKEHQKRNKIIFIVGGSLVGLVALLVLLSVLTNGKVLNPINKLVKTVTESESLQTRKWIWQNINLELSNGWWLLGRGFGTHNSMLFPMNILNNDMVCPSHSTYYAVLGQGGVFTLIAFIGSYIYFGYVFYKCFRVNKFMTLELSIGFFAYFFYSFTEGVNYLVVLFMLPLIWYYFLIRRGMVEKDNETAKKYALKFQTNDKY